MVNCRFLAEELEDAIRAHKQRSYKPLHIIDEFWKEFTVEISYWVAWRARSVALERIYGNYDRAYTLVPELCRQMILANPRSVATFSRSDVDSTFEGLCIAFRPFLDGFRTSCRPIIGLDGCFLKGKYGGVCLTATALDGNNGLYPLAIYICQGENYNTWWKFLDIIKPHISLHPKMISFMSDRQKGLIEAVAEHFKDNPHRFCFRHYYANFKKTYKGDDLKHLAWGAAKAYEKADYQVWADQLKKVNENAYNWLHDNAKKESWARSHFDMDAKCEHVTNNFSESFNKWILDLREWPLIAFVEKFHLMMMSLLYERRKKAKTWNIDGLVPRAARIIDGFINDKIRFYRVHGLNDRLYSVNEYNTTNRWTVDISQRSCTCCVWDITGIPCVHGVSVLNSMRPNWASYCSEFHRVSTYLKAYDGYIRPMALVKEWSEPPVKVVHPEIERPVGRPRKQRIRGEDEGPAGLKQQRKCTLCGGKGHNMRTCKGPPAQGKKKQYKPRKKAKVGPSTGAPVAAGATGPSIAVGPVRPPVAAGPIRPSVAARPVRPPVATGVATPPTRAGTVRPPAALNPRYQPRAVAQTATNYMRLYGHKPDHLRAPTIPPEQVFRPKLVPKRKGKEVVDGGV